MAIPLEVTLLLHRLRGWRIERLPEGDGNDRLFFCLPMLENGIVAIDRSNKECFNTLSRMKSVFIKFRAIPNRSRKSKELYTFALSLPPVYYMRLIELGMQPQEWYHQAVGKITKWICLQERKELYEHRKRGKHRDTCS